MVYDTLRMVIETVKFMFSSKSSTYGLTWCVYSIIIYHDFLPTPRRGSHVKSGKTHTQSSRYTP